MWLVDLSPGAALRPAAPVRLRLVNLAVVVIVVVYPLAIQAAQSINSFGTPEARGLAEQLAAIAERHRQRLSKTPDSAIINTIDKALKRGQFAQALALITRVRSGFTALHQKIMLDNFEVIANLPLGQFTAAADGIDRILGAAEKAGLTCRKLSKSCPSRLGMP